MKKVLSFVLVLAMVLGCFSTVFAKEFADVAADADCHDAVAVLSDLGVCAGKSETSFDPEGIVNRAEMAAFIINALGITPTANAQTKFTDVEPSKWYSGYVAYANSLGIISGRSETIFDPEAQVSYDEAITMLINALGYTADALTGTYPAAYVSKAKTLGILEDVDALGTVKCNRGDVAIMLYNTLTSPIGHTDKDGAWTAAAPKDTMMGRLGASLIDTNADGKADLITVTEDIIAGAAMDLSDYLGKVITAYADKNGKIIAVYTVESETLEGKYTGTKIGTYKLASSVKGTDDIVLFTNGESADKTVADLVTDTKYVFEVTLDGNYVTSIASAQKWTETKTFQVSKAMVKELADKNTLNGYEFEMTSKDEIDTTSFQLAGVDSLGAIAKDNVVTVYERPTEKTLSKVEVSTEVVTGKITKLATKATINGTQYEAATGYTFPEDFTNEYNFFLDFEGDVFASEKVTSETTKSYGILVDFACTEATGDWSSTGTEKSFQAKVFTAEGKEVVYDVEEDTTKLDGITLADKTSLNADLNKLVEFELDEDGYLVALKKVTGTNAKDMTVNAKLVLDGKYFATNALVFVYEYDTTDGYEWSLGDTAKLAKVKLEEANSNGAYYVLDEDKAKIEVLVMADSDAQADAVFGIYTGESQIGTAKCEVYFMVDGEEVTYNVASKTSGFTFTGNFGKITFTGSEPTGLGAATDAVSAMTITSKAAISGNTFTADGTTYYALDADVLVYYVNEDKEVSVGSTDDMVDDDNAKVALFCTSDTADKVYEVVVVYEKAL